ncbi:bifunctional thymidylate/uridylate kinase [Martiniozyma asiatica (nom. inval.)]|nr:bifunctional thymidylate/uridylate kinase [Martiniozyma asiatica]
MKRYPLIAIEGLDRTGKTTQTDCLLETLASKQIPHTLMKFPDRTTPIGKLINQYLTDPNFELNDKAAHLLFSANRWELVDTFNKWINEKVIVMDRYVWSGVAYSAAKGLDSEWCLNPDKGLPKPDITIFLKFKNEMVISNREGFGEERYEKVEFQKKVKSQFEKLESQQINSVNGKWINIFVDDKSIEDVREDIWAALSELCENKVDDNLYHF